MAVSSFGVAPESVGYLDTPKVFTFDAWIDPATVTPASVSIDAVAGPGVGQAVRGLWRVRDDRVEFVPELPHGEPVLTSGGLQPGTTYLVAFQGGNVANAIRTIDGRWLAESLSATFITRSGTLPQHVFASNVPGPPQLLAVTCSPQNEAGEWLLGSSARPAEMRLTFDQPLDPSDANLLRRPTAAARGLIELVYDDVVYGSNTWVEANVELERNAIDGATVVLRPRGVLPSAAQLRLSVSGLLRDLFGESRGINQPEVEWLIDTEPALEPQQAALEFAFSNDVIGAADFTEVPAVVIDGVLSLPEAFPDLPDVGDWSAGGGSQFLRTDEQRLVYDDGRSRTFEGGVFHVKNLHIGAGQAIRGVGPNPLVLIVDGDAHIDGVLTVGGGNAQKLYVGGQYRGPGDFLPSGTGQGTAPPLPNVVGPAAGAGGGRGGGSHVDMPSTFGSPGLSAPGTIAGGGSGGVPLVTFACGQAPGGGGGGAATPGDPWFPSLAGPSGSFPQRAGNGGAGCGKTLAGGLAGQSWFQNASSQDDFWGRAYVPRERRAITGELARVVGGSGGGSGGSLDLMGSALGGGDGGGGGGALVLQVRGTLTIGPHGRIDADGGDGRGGAHDYMAPIAVGGGGGGAGGMVVLMAGEGIVMHVKGDTFANRDYDFAISADGGVCRSAPKFLPFVTGKYPANGESTILGSEYDSAPMGGFGAMGLVQLMVPVGTTNDDGTNTVLDDAITVMHNGVPLQGLEKQRFLGWRGFPDENGVYVDDFGNPTGTIGGQGDIRPDPMLMPVPFMAHGKARARSKWLPLGSLFRRRLLAPDGLPRGVLGENLTFARHARSDGWIPFGSGRLLPELSTPGLLPEPAAISLVALDTETLGRPAFRVDLAAPLPQATPDAYAGRLAVLRQQGGGAWVRSRVLSSDEQTLFLDANFAMAPNALFVQLHTWPADLASAEPGSYLDENNEPMPRANARIGFAFHRDPEAAVLGFDPARFPPEATTFLFDLSDPATRAALQAFGPRYLQWDVTLDSEFRGTSFVQPPPADETSRIALHRFWLPVKY